MNRAKSGELAHAYLMSGTIDSVPAISIFLKKTGIDVKANPDVYVREYLGFGIDDARDLRERANTRAVAGDRRVFIVVTPSMTNDAQNALLKTLEEPPADAVFFFVVASPDTLLSTLRSRAQMLTLDSEKGSAVVDAKEFLALSPQKRLDLIKPLYVKEEDEERDIRGAVALLSDLERLLSKKVNDEDVRQGIHAIYLARKHLMDKGSLLRPLLEQVALLTPQV